MAKLQSIWGITDEDILMLITVIIYSDAIILKEIVHMMRLL